MMLAATLSLIFKNQLGLRGVFVHDGISEMSGNRTNCVRGKRSAWAGCPGAVPHLGVTRSLQPPGGAQFTGNL